MRRGGVKWGSILQQGFFLLLRGVDVHARPPEGLPPLQPLGGGALVALPLLPPLLRVPGNGVRHEVKAHQRPGGQLPALGPRRCDVHGVLPPGGVAGVPEQAGEQLAPLLRGQRQDMGVGVQIYHKALFQILHIDSSSQLPSPPLKCAQVRATF